MSTTSRGNDRQNEARIELERDGWLVETAVPQIRKTWSRELNDYVTKPQHDFFTVADHIAVKADRVRFIQVTGPNGVHERVAKIRDRIPAKLLDAPLLSWEVWSRQPRGGFVIHLVGSGTPIPTNGKESQIV